MPMTKETRKILVAGKTEQKGKNNLDEKTRKSLHYSVVEGSVSSASSSLFDSYIIPFLLALGGTSGQVGILTAAKNLAYTAAMIPGAKLTEYYKRKSIWLTARIMSRLVFALPLIVLAFFPSTMSVYLVIVFAPLAVFFMSISNPAWSSLIGDLVPMGIRGRYFGQRNMFLGITGIIATILGGYLLSLYGFPIIFILFAGFGLMAIPFFMRMYEKPFPKTFHYKHSFTFRPREWSGAIKTNKSFALFTTFMALMNFAVMISSPFYTVYIIRDLHIDYGVYALIITAGAFARILSFKYWGRMNDRFGSRRILIVTGILGIVTPFLMLWSNTPIAIAAVFIVDGLIWAGFDLVTFNYLLDIIPAAKRPQFVANHNFFVGICVVIGALTGGVLATVFEGQTFLIFTGLHLVFLASFIIRLFILPLLSKISDVDVKQTEIAPVRYVFWNTVAVEPAREIMQFMTYSFRYPYEIQREIKNRIATAKYKIKIVR